MDGLDIRRLYITDEEWSRTSESWKQLKPLRDLNTFSEQDESKVECFVRLTAAGYHIPLAVIEQWIYPHYYNRNSVNNYGWIDYRKARFSEMILSVDELAKLNVIKDYRYYVEMRARSKPFASFMCIPEDVDHWRRHRTWRTPPVVLDVTSLPRAPEHAELSGPLQLVEGHSRLGYLLAMENAGMLEVREHKVFLLRHS